MDEMNDKDRKANAQDREANARDRDANARDRDANERDRAVNAQERIEYQEILNSIRILKAADKYKDELLAHVAHDLRNFLGPILGHILLLKRTTPALPVADDLERQVRRFTRLIDDLMDTSRIQAGQLNVIRAPLDLRPVITEVAKVMDAEVVIPPVPCEVEADSLRLEQVLYNLLSNAQKFTDPDERHIAVTLDIVTPFYEVTVKDNGCGFEPEQKKELFKFFSRLNPGKPGLGVGLAISKKIVEAHGGTLDVTSEGLGKGCEVTLRLPMPKAA
jgi:two-component system CheB/CheR fusion protein